MSENTIMLVASNFIEQKAIDALVDVIRERDRLKTQVNELEQQLKTARGDAVRDAIEYADEKSKWPDDWIGLIKEYANSLESK